MPSTVKGFRNDYAHYLKPWQITPIAATNPIHLFLIKHSDLYALLFWKFVDKSKMQNKLDGRYYTGVSYYPEDECLQNNFFEKTGGKYVFLRNLKTIKSIVNAYGAKLLIITGPFSKEPTKKVLGKYQYAAFDRFNDYIRQFSRDNHDIIFYDLDRDSRFLEEFFTDGYHVNQEGQKRKAELILAFLHSSVLNK
jgi:hypothetical protein